MFFFFPIYNAYELIHNVRVIKKWWFISSIKYRYFSEWNILKISFWLHISNAQKVLSFKTDNLEPLSTKNNNSLPMIDLRIVGILFIVGSCYQKIWIQKVITLVAKPICIPPIFIFNYVVDSSKNNIGITLLFYNSNSHMN